MKIKEKDKKAKKAKMAVNEYPCLRKGNVSGSVYMFLDNRTCIKMIERGLHSVGRLGKVHQTDIDMYLPYNEKLVLSND